MSLESFDREELLQLSWNKPMMAQLELIRDCNQRCVFCFRACRPEKKYSTLSLENWEVIILKLKRLGVRRLDFSGGENFLYSRFAELMAFSKAHGFTIVINTNGTFGCEAIANYADEVIFSIHGLGSVHDAITDMPGSFSRASNHIEETAKLTKVSVNMVLIKPNYRQMNTVFEYFDQLCGLYKFSPIISIRSCFGSEHGDYALDVTRELLDDYKERISRIPAFQLELKHGFQSIYFNDPTLYKLPGFPLPNCAAGKYKLVINHDGSVYPCNFFRGPEFYCGNILLDDEEDLWRRGKGFARFRSLVLRESIPEKCKGCQKKARCFSGCRSWAEGYERGGFENAADRRCEIGDAFVGS